MPIITEIEKNSKRPLSKEEALAVKTYLRLKSIEDLFVAMGKNDFIRQEFIMRKTAPSEVGKNKNESDLTDKEIQNHVIVCSLLWLARLDVKDENIFANKIDEERLKLPENVMILEDTLVTDHLGHLRSEKTSLRNFRFHSNELCADLFRKAVAELAMNDVEITNDLVKEMGLETMNVPRLAEKVIVVPILRAGLALFEPAMKALPKSKIGLMGLRRNEETLEPEKYLIKLPQMEEDSVVIVTDPMLATGGSISSVIDEINAGEVKPKEIIVVCVVAAPEGIAAINQKHGVKVKIITAAVDSHLNERGFIVPGLGDYGDRYTGV